MEHRGVVFNLLERDLVEWAEDVALDAAAWEALQAARVIPDAVVALELSDELAVERLLVKAPAPTLKDAEKALRRERALALLTEEDEAPTMVRVPAHLFSLGGEEPRLPAAGTRLVVRVLLGQIDGVRPVSEETA